MPTTENMGAETYIKKVEVITLAVAAERERCAKIAESIQAPKSIGRDHGKHHEAGAQAAARAIRNSQ